MSPESFQTEAAVHYIMNHMLRSSLPHTFISTAPSISKLTATAHTNPAPYSRYIVINRIHRGTSVCAWLYSRQ